MKKFFKKLKDKIKSIFRKLGGVEEKTNNEFAVVNIFYNDELRHVYRSTSKKISRNFCDLIKEFSKNDDYVIIYDYPERTINITFNVKTKNK